MTNQSRRTAVLSSLQKYPNRQSNAGISLIRRVKIVFMCIINKFARRCPLNRWRLWAAFSLVSALALAADVSGKWVGEVSTTGRGGAAPTITFNFKVEGSRLSGEVTQSSARGDVVATISDGKIEGDEVSFSSKREARGNSITTKYTGKIVDNTLVLQADSGRGSVTVKARRCPPDCPK
jgi:hypothetical protein